MLTHTFEGGFPGELLTVQMNLENSPHLLDTGDGYVIDFTAPILYGRAGFVHVGMDETSMHEKINQTSRTIITLTLLVGILGVLMAYIAGNYLTRPIRSLVKGTEEIGRGNLGYQIKTDSTDEINILSNAFNKMSHNLNTGINELRESEERYRRLVDSISDAVILIDSQKKILSWNSGAQKIFGYCLEEVAGSKINILFYSMNEADNLEIPDGENVCKRKDGSNFPGLISNKPMLDRRNAGNVLVIKDIKEQKEMANLEKLLRRSEKLFTLGKLAAGVAHEINNPLTAISLHTQIMLRKTWDEKTDSRLIWTTFTKLYGTPNNIGHSSICADASKKARLCIDGTDDYCAYDWENCNYVLNFGGATLEAWRPTNLMLQRWAHMRRGRPVRAKQVMVDTRFSTTAIKADEWLPVKPGTDGALALGISHVILTEGLWDRSFVGDFKSPGRKFITGETVANEDFEEKWTLGLIDYWNNVIINFTPAKASEITGIPDEQIIRIAKEFGSTKPAIAAGERGAGAHTNGTYNHMVIHALNALVGSMFAQGGVMYQMGVPYASPSLKEDDYLDDIAKKVAADFKAHTLERIDEAKSDEWPLASNVYQNVPDHHLKGKPYKLSMMFTYYTNPLFSMPDPQRARDAFKDVFIVETSSYLSETALYADYILPDAYYLERRQDSAVYASTGFPVSGFRGQAVQPIYDNRDSVDVIIDLGKRMGGKTGEYFTLLGSHENMLREIAKGFEKTPGDNGVNGFDSWAEKGAWYKKPYIYRFSNGKFFEWDGTGYNNEMKKTEEEIEEVKDGIKVKTIIVKDPVKDKLLKTKSGKFEFRSSKLEGFTDNQKEILKSELKSPELYAYPHYEEPHFAGKEEGFPLHMSSPKMITHAEGRGANTQWLQERFGIVIGKGWTSWVELNPDKADELGIKNGDEVWVESLIGKIKVMAVINPGNPPWMVVFPFEHGHWNYGRYAKGLGANPNEIMANLSAVISAQSCTNATMVKVYRA